MKFGNSNTRIAASGFEDYLTRIYFPDNAGKIYFGSQSLPNLETLVFGSSATTVHWGFGVACNVTSLLLPETTQDVFFNNFANTKVVRFVIPQNVTTSLKPTPPSTLRTFERYGSGVVGMSGASGLESLTIGGNAAKTGTYMSAVKLKSVEFPEPSKVTEVSGQAFDGCSSLVGIKLPSSVTTLGYMAFRNCKALYSAVIPAGVTAIERNTFQNCSDLTAIDLPGVTRIEEYAFSGCKSLSDVGLHEGLTKIGQYAFDGCTNLHKITFPSTLTSVGQYAFRDCSTGFIPGTAARIVTVGYSAFKNSGIDEFMVYPETTLGASAFEDSDLRFLEIQEGITYIPSKCFYGTTALKSVAFPASLLKIEDYAFYGSSINPTFSGTGGLTFIGKSAFENGVMLIPSPISIPDSVTDIGDLAFARNNLTSLVIRGNPNIGYKAFQNCKSLADVDIPWLKVIPQSCFPGCSNLATVQFSSDVRIGALAFSGCGFTEINILEKLAALSEPTTYGGYYGIGSGAFRDCKSLLSVDGYEYLWDVYIKAVYGDKGEDGNWSYRTTYTRVAKGVYNYMGATENSVFEGTAMKTASNFPKSSIPTDVTTDTHTERYSVINWTSRDLPA